MKTLYIFVAIFCHSALALARNDRSTNPKKNKYDSDEDYSDTDNESTLPQTAFKCDDKKDGFYADIENGCKSFHYCQTFVFPDDDPERKDWVFLCPPTLIFRQEYLTCTKPSKKFRCEDSEQYFDVNEELPPVQPGEVPTLPPAESNTTDPSIEEETTQPPTTTTTKPPKPTTKPPKPKPTTKPPKPKPTTKPPKPTTSTTPTPIPTEDPITEEATETEPETPDSSETDEETEDLKKKKPDNSFLLPPLSDSNFALSPFISLIPNLQSSFHLKPVHGKDPEKEKMNMMPEKAGIEDKVDLKNPLTLDQYLQKTSWENIEKNIKLPGVLNFLKAPLVFPASTIPRSPLPLLKVVNEQLPILFHPHHFDEILYRYNGEVISDKDEPIGPR